MTDELDDRTPMERLLDKTLDQRDAALAANPAAAELAALRTKVADLEKRASPAAAPQPEPLTKEAIERMTPAQINADWKRISAFLAGRREPGALTPDELAGLDKLDPKTINANWPAVAAELKRRGSK